MAPQSLSAPVCRRASWHRSAAGALLALAATVITGCTQETPQQQTLREVAHYATLPGAQASHHPQLQAELARLMSERATPLLLMAVQPGESAQTAVSPGQQPLPHDENVAAALGHVFSKERLKLAIQQAERQPTIALFPIDQRRLRSAAVFRRTFEPQRQAYRKALTRPRCNFEIDYAQGILADLNFTKILVVGNRLEGVWAAEAMEAGNLPEALQSLKYMLKAVQHLAAEQHLTTRLQAVQLRTEALAVLEAICQDPRCTRALQREVLSLLQEQLSAWPYDAAAWIGDRAQGLHTYELIRDGHLMSLLEFAEIQQLKAEIDLVERLKVLPQTIDEDQLFYLRAMRSIINSCQLPYYKRLEILEAVRRELDMFRETPRYPWIAERLLLIDFEMAHQLQALDRAQVEAWTLAVSVALDQKPTIDHYNPLDGVAWIVRQQENHILVDGLVTESGRPILVRQISSGARNPSPEFRIEG